MAIIAKALQQTKIDAVACAKTLFEGYSDFIFTDYRGLTVEQITDLRQRLRTRNSAYRVVKNNFARIAFSYMHIDSVSDFLTGPTAVALAKEDVNEIAKILFDFAKDTSALGIKGGYVSQEVYDIAKLEAFSKLPGKKQLIAMIMSVVNAPVQKLAATIQAYADKKADESGITQVERKNLSKAKQEMETAATLVAEGIPGENVPVFAEKQFDEVKDTASEIKQA